MPARAAPVRIGRLDLDAPAGVRGPALAALDHASWPEASTQAWLLIRRLEVAANAPGLGRAAGAAAARVAADAISGWSPFAATAGAVRFTDLADLLACLSRDMSDGRAQGLWFWDGWEGPTERAPVTSLWCQNILELPRIFVRLAASDDLGRVLATLSIEEIETIRGAVARHTGWREPERRQPSTAPVSDAVRELLREHAFSHYRRALVGVPRSVTAPAARLLATVGLWHVRPHALAAPSPSGVDLIALAEALAARSGAVESPAPAATAADALTAAREATAIDRVSDRVEEDRQTPAPAPPLKDPNTQTRAAGRTPADREEPAMTGAPPASPEPVDQLRPSDMEHVTMAGGVFYLINALETPEVVAVVTQSGASGWAWLWSLGAALDGSLDAGLGRFVSAMLNCAPEALAELPPPDGFQRVAARLERRYGALNLWNAELLTVPAAFRCTETHLDVDLPLKAARVDVRRAGLDRDPGWVRWLGRVVAFHFVPDPPWLTAVGEAHD